MQNAMKAFASYMREWVASQQINIFTRIDSASVLSLVPTSLIFLTLSKIQSELEFEPNSLFPFLLQQTAS